MPQMTDLLVKDDTITTPVEYTLKPVDDHPPRWRASVASVPLDGQITFSLNQETLKSGTVKMTGKLEVPVMETLGASGTSTGYVAPPRVAHKTVAIFTMFTDKRATTQNRADTLKMMLGLLQGASSTTATGVLANTSAGNAFVNTVLPVPNALIHVIQPS